MTRRRCCRNRRGSRAVRTFPYGVPNYAAPGAESRRYKNAYWRFFPDYAGIGPGAHGRITLDGALFATRRHAAPEVWAERVERDEHGTTDETALPPVERAREMLLMGLRLAAGSTKRVSPARTGAALDEKITLKRYGMRSRKGMLRVRMDV